MSRQAILDKIAKLAAVADDQRGKPEGQTAERKVVELAHKYRVDLSEANKQEPFVQVSINTMLKRMPRNESVLYRAIGDYCGVLVLMGWAPAWPQAGEWYRAQKLYGYKSDIEDVRYLFNVISSQVKTQIASKMGGRSAKAKRSYEAGLICGINKRLSILLDGIVAYNGEKGLVPLSKPEEQISKIITVFRLDNIKDAGGGPSVFKSEFESGWSDSKNISIHRAVHAPVDNGCLLEAGAGI